MYLLARSRSLPGHFPIHSLAVFAGTARLWKLERGTCGEQVEDFQARSHKLDGNQSIVYRLFVPIGYQVPRKYPLMLTLHGAGERGDDNTSQLKHDFNRMWA